MTQKSTFTPQQTQKNESDSTSLLLERAVVGALLVDADSLRCYFPLLKKEMFFSFDSWAFLSSAMALHLAGAYSKAAVISESRSAGVTSAEEKYAMFMAAFVPSPDAVQKHYRSWIDRARRRFYDVRAKEIEQSSTTGDAFLSARIALAQEAKSLGIPDIGVSLDDALISATSRIQRIRDTNGADFLQTGLADLDHYLIGLMPSTLTVVSARPSVGKTSFACQIALLAASVGKKVLFNSMEMPKELLAIRMAGISTSVNTMRFTAPHRCEAAEFASGMSALATFRSPNIRITCHSDSSKLEAAIRYYRPDVVLHDFLQYPPTPSSYRGNRPEYLGDMTRFFAETARDRDIIAVLLSQMGRGKESTDMGAGKGSAGIEENADTLLNLDAPHRDQPGADRLKRVFYIAKARYGFAGVSVETMMNDGCQRFENWDIIRATKIAKSLGYV